MTFSEQQTIGMVLNNESQTSAFDISINLPSPAYVKFDDLNGVLLSMLATYCHPISKS